MAKNAIKKIEGKKNDRGKKKNEFFFGVKKTPLAEKRTKTP
jgi:hypothetical protein